VRPFDAEKFRIGVGGTGCWKFTKGHPSPRRQGDSIPGGVRPETWSPFLKLGMAGFGDFGGPRARTTSPIWTGGMFGGIGHPDSLVGIDGEYFLRGRGLWAFEMEGTGHSMS